MTSFLTGWLVLAWLCVPWVDCAQQAVKAKTSNSIPSTFALSFMRRFGYLEGAWPSPPDRPTGGGGGGSNAEAEVYVGDRIGAGNSSMGRPDSETLYTEEAVVEAIRLVQKFGALEQTGVLDEPTKKLMTARRCGCPDVRRDQNPGAPPPRPPRRRRYVISSEGWKKRHLKYFIANWTPKLGEEAVNEQMLRAFDAWSQYGRLRFSKVSMPGDADITVAFGRGSHGDWFPFDGPGGILAHAFYPYEMASYGGDIHFDDDEQWAANPNASALYEGAVDLFLVAVHELGHSLGLGHSPDPSSIMFPYYQTKSNSFSLGQDDILAMYELYIKRSIEEDITYENIRPTEKSTSSATRTTSTTQRTTTPLRPRPSTRRPRTTTRRPNRTTVPPTNPTRRPRPPHPPPPPPHRPHIPVVRPYPHTPTFEGDDETVDEHKKHDKKHGIPDSPVGTNSEENDIPDLCAGQYDAVAQLRGELFVFKGKHLWRLQSRGVLMRGYPVSLQRMFQDLPVSTPKLDAVYQRNDGNIILFSGPRYWVYNGQQFIENSPQPLWRYGLPRDMDRVDAVMVWAKNSATYFFRESKFWRYNVTTSRMDHDYPQEIGDRWHGVPNSIDDAMTWTNGVTYFFKGKKYYQFNNERKAVEYGYPQTAPQYWFGC